MWQLKTYFIFSSFKENKLETHFALDMTGFQNSRVSMF